MPSRPRVPSRTPCDLWFHPRSSLRGNARSARAGLRQPSDTKQRAVLTTARQRKTPSAKQTDRHQRSAGRATGARTAFSWEALRCWHRETINLEISPLFAGSRTARGPAGGLRGRLRQRNPRTRTASPPARPPRPVHARPFHGDISPLMQINPSVSKYPRLLSPLFEGPCTAGHAPLAQSHVEHHHQRETHGKHQRPHIGMMPLGHLGDEFLNHHIEHGSSGKSQ